MAGTKIYGQLIRAQAESAAADLTPAATGLFYFNSVSTSLKWYTGAAWLTTVDTSTSQVLTNKDYDGGTASNTSRLTVPKASNATLTALTRKQGTVVYDTTANKPLFDNGTTLSSFGSGSGAGEVNAVLNPSAADDLTGWTNGTSHTATRVTSGSPLDPVTTTALSIAATTTAAESSTSGEYYTVTTHPTGLRNKKLKVEFYFTTEASQTWAVSVYSGSTRMVLSTDASGATLLPAGTTGKFVTYVDTDSSTSYKINFTRTAGSGTATLLLTSVIFGPGIQPQGAIVGPWTAYTPSSSLTTNVTHTGFYRRVGDSIELKTKIAFSGTNTQGFGISDAQNLNGLGLTVDTSKLSSPDPVGIFEARDSSASQIWVGEYIRQAGADTLLLYSNGSSAALNVATSANRPFTWDSGDTLCMHLKLPISEWAGSGTVNLASNDLEYAYNTSTNDANDTTSFGYGPVGNTMLGPLTAGRTKRVRFQSPILATDSLTLEIQLNSSSPWVPVSGFDGSIGAHIYMYQNGTTYGMSVKSAAITNTDIDVQFGQYQWASSTYGAAGAAWATASGRWRLKKEAAGKAVGFGLVSSASAGLMPSTLSNLDDVAATRMGLKAYAHGTTYNGGIAPTITLSSGGGTLNSVDRSVFIPYQMQDGSWRLKMTASVVLSSTSRTAALLAINGITTKASSGNYQQPLYGINDSGGTAMYQMYMSENSNIVNLRHAAQTASAYIFSADIELASKPTWAY